MSAAGDADKVAEVPGLTDVCPKQPDGKLREDLARYERHFAKSGDRAEGRRDRGGSGSEKSEELVDWLYTLITDFYEYGYGASFHFGPIRDGQSLAECLKSYEEEIASTLKAKPGMKILDIGCGVGGPARTIARFSGATITGLNICQYQINRATELTKKHGLQDKITYVKGNYCNMEFPESSFDGLYALESTLYAEKPVDVYREVYRVLKPGALFVDSAWAMTDLYDPSNPTHVKIKEEIEYSSGVHQMRTVKEILEGMKEAGLEVVSFRNCHHEGDKPWYVFLEGESMCSFQSFRASSIGRLTTHFLVNVLETFRILPQGSSKVHKLLRENADCITEGGKLDIFTPMFRIVARKPVLST